MSTPIRFAIAGPSGAGKSCLARALATQNANAVVVGEPSPSLAILKANALMPRVAMAFQQAISIARVDQVRSNRNCHLLIFDRTFEEDREVFLPLYEQLGYLHSHQLNELRDLSLGAEAEVGRLDVAILLTAGREVLRRRVLSDVQSRPRWLLRHLDLEYSLYDSWIEVASQRFQVHDTSALDLSDLSQIGQQHVERLLERQG